MNPGSFGCNQFARRQEGDAMTTIAVPQGATKTEIDNAPGRRQSRPTTVEINLSRLPVSEGGGGRAGHRRPLRVVRLGVLGIREDIHNRAAAACPTCCARASTASRSGSNEAPASARNPKGHVREAPKTGLPPRWRDPAWPAWWPNSIRHVVSWP